MTEEASEMGLFGEKAVRVASWLGSMALVAALTVSGCGGGGGGGSKSFIDLQVIDFTVVVNGNIVNWTVTIENRGNLEAINFFVDVYENRVAPPIPQLPGDHFQNIGSLKGGESRDVNISTFGAIPGDYASYVQIDYLESVADSNRNNNVDGPLPFTVLAPVSPDLSVTAFSAVVSNFDVEYTITVENLGDGDASSFFLDLYYDLQNPPSPGDPADDFNQLAGLAEKSSLTFIMTRPSALPGNSNSWVIVDSQDQVSESDEGNNREGALTVSVGAPPGPEIVVSSLSISAVGQDVTYDLLVENAGLTDAGAFSVDLYYDRALAPGVGDTGDDLSVVPSLTAGTSIPIQFVRMSAPTGIYRSWVQVDTFDAIPEAFEGNNVVGPESVLVGPEVAIVYSRLAFNGADVDYTMLIENFGSEASGAFFVDLYYDRAPSTPPIIPLDIGDDFDLILDLLPGATIQVNLVLLGASGGSNSWMTVDAADSIIEIDESNNIVGPVFYNATDTLSSDLRVDLVLTSVAADIITYDVAITNLGATATNPFDVDVYLDRPVAPLVGDFSPDNLTGLTLAAGASMNVQVDVRAQPGTYRSWVQLDTGEDVPESNEGNNVSPPIPVTVP